jgi:hypothetical protein
LPHLLKKVGGEQSKFWPKVKVLCNKKASANTVRADEESIGGEDCLDVVC